MTIQAMKHEAHRAVHRRTAAFTLIEIMVVIAILGLLLTVVGRAAWTNMREARVGISKTKMSQLANGALTAYRRHYSKLPDTLEELLLEGERNLNEVYAVPIDLRDAWENDFRYERISNSKFTLVSFGADGIEGGEAGSDDADIVYPDDFEK
jgi:general secretion pathway protein G